MNCTIRRGTTHDRDMLQCPTHLFVRTWNTNPERKRLEGYYLWWYLKWGRNMWRWICETINNLWLSGEPAQNTRGFDSKSIHRSPKSIQRRPKSIQGNRECHLWRHSGTGSWRQRPDKAPQGCNPDIGSANVYPGKQTLKHGRASTLRHGHVNPRGWRISNPLIAKSSGTSLYFGQCNQWPGCLGITTRRWHTNTHRSLIHFF